MEMAQVVYCLSRGGHMEHPHMIQVQIPKDQAGLRLRDVKKLLITMRGGGMADSFCWSFKRVYKNNYIWHDLSSDDDVISPVLTGEYILKGSEIYDSSHTKRVPVEAKRDQGLAHRKGERVSVAAATAAGAASLNLAEYRIHDSALFNAKSPRTVLLVHDISKLGTNKSLSNSLNRQVMDSLSSAEGANQSISSDSSVQNSSTDAKVYHRLRVACSGKTVTVATQTDEQENASCNDLPPLKSRTISKIPGHSHLVTGSPRTPEPSRAVAAPGTPGVAATPATSVDKNMLARICLRRGGSKEEEPSPVSSARLRGHSFRQLLCGVVEIRSQGSGLSPEHQASTPHSSGWLWKSRSRTDCKSATSSERENAGRLAKKITPEQPSSAPDDTRPSANEPPSPDHVIGLRRALSCSSPAMSLSSAEVCTSPTGSYSSSAVDSGQCESSCNSEASEARNISATQSASPGEATSTPRESFSSRHSFGGFERDYLQLDKLSNEDPKEGGMVKPLPPGFHKGMNDTKLRVRTTPRDGVKDLTSPRVPHLSRAVAKHHLTNSAGARQISGKASPRSTLEWWNESNSPRAEFRARGDRYTPGRSSVDSLRGNSADWSRSSIDWSRSSLDGKTLQDLAVAMLPPPEFRQHVEDCLQCGRTFKPESVKAHMKGCHVHRAKLHTANPNAVVVRRHQ